MYMLFQVKKYINIESTTHVYLKLQATHFGSTMAYTWKCDMYVLSNRDLLVLEVQFIWKCDTSFK
jgi:hypothetical protein